MTASLRMFCLLRVVALTACDDSGSARAAAGESATNATANVGDGMCKEHGVLEAVYTKCNPALIPVFKAKGDWCEEHQFPESFCPICHREKGGRPSMDVKGSGAPADGTRVTFKTKETARLAGIEVVKAAARPSQSSISVTARIVYDATKVAEINANEIKLTGEAQQAGPASQFSVNLSKSLSEFKWDNPPPSNTSKGWTFQFGGVRPDSNVTP